MLGSMKSVKMLGFTEWLAALVQGLRVTELKESTLSRRLLVVRVFWQNSISTLAPFVTFVFFAMIPEKSHPFNVNSAYTTLSLVSLLSSPVNGFIRSIPAMLIALTSLGRIQEFLYQSTSDEIELSDLSHLTFSPSSEVIVARDVSFAWSDHATFSVHDINLTVRKGQFCLIIGPTGCGKSTLMKGILGETPSIKGFLYSKSIHTAYVDQSPWIRNTSFKDNILGVSNYTKGWYDEVVNACGLEQDAANLPNGHFTKVGSAGISLSGGQKQRLALARAVYAEKPVVILDDIFSGLDAETEEHIFKNLFSRNGLFRRLRTTVLLATHAVHRLSYADHIVAMGSDGSIFEQGTLKKLKADGGYVTLMAQHKTQARDEGDGQQQKTPRNVITSSGPGHTIDAMTEVLSRQNGDLSLYAYYFRSVSWASAALSIILLAIAGVVGKLSDLLVNIWVSALERTGSSVNPFYLGLYGMLSIMTNVTLVGGAYHYIMIFTPLSSIRLHERLLKTVMHAPLTFFTSVDIGTITNRFSQDMTLIDHDLPYSAADFVVSFFIGLMSVVLMCTSARYFAVVMPPVFLFMWVLQKFYLRTSRQMRILDLEAKSPLFSQFIESLSGLVTIRAMGWAAVFKDQNLDLLDTSQKPFYLLFCIQRWLELALDLMVAVLGGILMIIVVKLRGEVGAGYVGLAILNVITFSQSLSQILRMWAQLETSMGAVARVRDFVANTASEHKKSRNDGLEPTLSSWPSEGAIELRDVYASYKAGENEPRVLRSLNLSIQPGQKIGICGRSGSGKSSLLATLLRMLEVEPQSQILIDGVEITSLPPQITRNALNAIPQEPFLTHGSVRANMDPSDIKSPEQIERALRRVELWDVVVAKGGLDVALDANFFSHGQRQLFCLARALLRSSKILVLDEVTSNVDVASDALMQRVIREEFSDCTILAVAHRLETIINFDRIAVMQDGMLIEFDTPEALLKTDSAFKELYES
ncbi:hypothetical protein N7495_003491 [Penicillium taxi]|uniref:uncharacterized protein n=1 Tax=Penicillium taxi TaxID=168475 RepID=UPI00254511DD|nr:uncharacterized protein N7495_003491 [Penicillium taxi]KAJ5898747.1 hypothetical protein N7495_003491 [Penicillium taxi]